MRNNGEKSLMNAMMKYITFRNCYIFLILDFIIVPSSVILREFLFKTAQTSILILQLILSYLLIFYINIGFVKYSNIVDEEKFRKIMFFVIGIFFINFILNCFSMAQKFHAADLLNYLPLMPLGSILMFYAFRLIKNEEMKFFKILSNLNLYTFFISVIGMISFLHTTKNFTVSTKWIFILPFIVIGLIISIVQLYWQAKLFRWLSAKYDETNKLSWS